MNNKTWGPYLSDRQWGTVREDYSAGGDAWEFTTHDMARSKAWRWGEEGIGGISDDFQYLCFAPAFWNGADSIIKERYFGLTNAEGNHGEDVKELYYFLDNTPDHSYMKMLYKYPQNAFPYQELLRVNAERNRLEAEYEILDTGIFDDNAYFDIFIEYAKADDGDILINITAFNRYSESATLYIMPTIWFRNRWAFHPEIPKPNLNLNNGVLELFQQDLGNYFLHLDYNDANWLFTENETNYHRLHGGEKSQNGTKCGINDFVVNGDESIKFKNSGTKAAAVIQKEIDGHGSVSIRLRLTNKQNDAPFSDYDTIFKQKITAANNFYENIQVSLRNEEHKNIQRQAYAGMLWSKQFFRYDVHLWLTGDENQPPPPPQRWNGRNSDWQHVKACDIISMPDTWEYPWFAAWDLAFHAIVFARIDADFAKKQIQLLLSDRYQHPNGQIPAYEWNFSDVNPPVLAMAAWKIYDIDRQMRETSGDIIFLENIFQSLSANYQWWINQKDSDGNDIFGGGFLGLDNIGLFNRSEMLPDGSKLEQADGTAWVAMFSLNMMRIAVELSLTEPKYIDAAVRFFEQFMLITNAASKIGSDMKGGGLWSEEDGFFYDTLRSADGKSQSLKIRTLVGLVPLFAVEVLDDTELDKIPEFKSRISNFLTQNPELAALISYWHNVSSTDMRLLSMLRGHRTKALLKYTLDANEFLSDYGVRSVSKKYEAQPYEINIGGMNLSLKYCAAESDSGMFGGNSNWRGPIWFPMNYLIIKSLLRFHNYYGDDFKVEYPTGSKNFSTLKEIAVSLSQRLISIFEKKNGDVAAVNANEARYYSDENFKDYYQFYEYFHGDSGRGCGASHQTGWTGLIAELFYVI